MSSIAIVNGQVLREDGTIDHLPVRIEGARIDGFESGGDLPTIDCGGALVLPGIVDVHGDSFERYLVPRPGADFPLDIGLVDNDRALAANGITTAYLGVGFSWEPGLRGVESAMKTINGLSAIRDRLDVDTRVHLRFEVFNVDGADQAASLIEARLVDLVAFNDHVGQYEKRIDAPHFLEPWARNAALSVAEFVALLRKTRAREAEIPATLRKVVSATRAAGIPVASHDDETPAMRDAWHAAGATIAEFPCNRETARRARELGNPVVMGAPNVVRGGSQDGNVSAGEMVAERHCTILASDYYYPSLLNAAFRLFRHKMLSLPEAWALVSSNPASAVGLTDRGLIREGQRADLVIVEDRQPGAPRVMATIAAGRVVFVGGELLTRNSARSSGFVPIPHAIADARPAVSPAAAATMNATAR